MTDSARIAANVAAVRQRIAEAARRAGRAPGDVTLVAVSKYVDAVQTAALVQAGCFDLGESRPQLLWEKAAAIDDPRIRWHLIGHLQTNKVKRTLAAAALVHSVDSERLLHAIDAEATALGRTIDVLLEVNVSGDATKHGVAASGLPALVAAAAGCRQVRVRGLMTMASLEGDDDRTRREFAALRELRDRFASDTPPNVRLVDLSMGMSGDFELAIAEGATIVRVGSALFAGDEP
jgi:pyridoxal phosphate enzyme (YggS family)